MTALLRCLRSFGSKAALVLISVLAAACAAEPSLVGFPARDVESESEEATLLLADVQRIEAACDNLEPKSERRSGPLSADEEREVMRAVLGAQLVLSGDHFDYQEPPQQRRPGRPPLQLYPRLTSPAFVEPVRVADAAGIKALKWFVPVIYDRDAVYWDDSFRTSWLGWPPERVRYEDPGYYVSVWLIPHGAVTTRTQDAIHVDPYSVRPQKVSVPLEGEASFELPNVLPTRSAYGLILPVKTESKPDGVEPGYYDLRILPKFWPEGIETRELSGLERAINEGDWFEALRQTDRLAGSLAGADRRGLRSDFGRIADAVDGYPPTWFDPEVAGLRAAFVRIRDGEADLEGDILRLRGAIRAMLRSNEHPAPVWLDPPAKPQEPFCFVVSADWQYHADMTDVIQLLRLLDPSFLPGTLSDAKHALVAAPIQERIRKAKFLIAVGDVADGQGLSSSTGKTLVNSLGVAPPTSPYEEEFDDLAKILARFRLPVFAVPGNHDGFANYGGIANEAFSWAGRGLKVPGRFPVVGPLFHFPGELLFQIGSVLPVGIKFLRLAEVPFFDGLVQWRYRFGPAQFAFRYRGHSFLGLNSYDLSVIYRDQVGPLANNWGGGVKRHDVVWFDLMRQWLAGAAPPQPGDAPQRQFAFMHQDPRGARPYVQTYREGSFGCYDAVDAPLNALTFGYLGLGWSSINPLWLPVITPVVSNLPSQLLRGSSNFNQEWMKKGTITDSDCYGARPLIEAINAGLAKGPGGSGISHIFFGHDDVPVVSQWVDPDQGGRVFPSEDGGDWPDNMWGSLLIATPFFRTRTVAPPEWGRAMHIRDGRNAVVLRCDDVGQTGSKHGIFLVTVDPAKQPPQDVKVEWIELPD